MHSSAPQRKIFKTPLCSEVNKSRNSQHLYDPYLQNFSQFCHVLLTCKWCFCYPILDKRLSCVYGACSTPPGFRNKVKWRLVTTRRCKQTLPLLGPPPILKHTSSVTQVTQQSTKSLVVSTNLGREGLKHIITYNYCVCSAAPCKANGSTKYKDFNNCKNRLQDFLVKIMSFVVTYFLSRITQIKNEQILVCQYKNPARTFFIFCFVSTISTQIPLLGKILKKH